MGKGISTIGTTFSYSETESGVYTEIEIKSFPDPVGSSESIDSTTMKDRQYTSVPGLKGSNSAMDFTCNYDAQIYAAVEALEGKEVFQKLLFSDGSGFSWKGKLEIGLADGSVNNMVEMTLHSFKSADTEHIAPTAGA